MYVSVAAALQDVTTKPQPMLAVCDFLGNYTFSSLSLPSERTYDAHTIICLQNYKQMFVHGITCKIHGQEQLIKCMHTKYQEFTANINKERKNEKCKDGKKDKKKQSQKIKYTHHLQICILVLCSVDL